MVNVEARIRINGKEFEILVDVDKALELKKGVDVNIDNVLAANDIFYDIKKGEKASSSDLEKAFGSSDIKEVAKKIIKSGEVVLPAEYRKKEQETKVKQVVDFFTRNAVDPTTGNPISEKRIQDAIAQSGVKIENKPVDQQVSTILSKLKEIMPISIETKKLRVTVPAVHTGKVYKLLNENKEKEDWLANGDLAVIINIPAGLQMDFYDKLNSVTHGSAIVEEIKEW